MHLIYDFFGIDTFQLILIKKIKKRNLVNADLKNGKYEKKNSLNAIFPFIKQGKNSVKGNILGVKIKSR